MFMSCFCLSLLCYFDSQGCRLNGGARGLSSLYDGWFLRPTHTSTCPPWLQREVQRQCEPGFQVLVQKVCYLPSMTLNTWCYVFYCRHIFLSLCPLSTVCPRGRRFHHSVCRFGRNRNAASIGTLHSSNRHLWLDTLLATPNCLRTFFVPELHVIPVMQLHCTCDCYVANLSSSCLCGVYFRTAVDMWMFLVIVAADWAKMGTLTLLLAVASGPMHEMLMTGRRLGSSCKKLQWLWFIMTNTASNIDIVLIG